MAMTKKKKIWLIAIAAVLIAALLATGLALFFTRVPPYKKIPSPTGFASYRKPAKTPVEDADYYVSVGIGNDENDGSKARPFATIERAQQAVRARIAEGTATDDLVVAVMGGEYVVPRALSFGAADVLPDGKRVIYVSYDAEEVILNGGMNLTVGDFGAIAASDAARLSEGARDKVRVLDLYALGVTREQLGKLYAIGGFQQGEKYGEEPDHPAALEVFLEGERLNLARYPDADYAKIGKVVDYGEAAEHVEDIVDWNNTDRPRPPQFLVDDAMKARMANWQTPASDDNAIWAYGYFYWDWADASTPITSFDADKGQLNCKYSSPYGIREGQIYYVYNVFEELDHPGEYYVDRETGKLYLYVGEGVKNDARVSISLLTESILDIGRDARRLTFDGFTVEGTRADGITTEGSEIVLRNLLVRNIAANGITVRGSDNLVEHSEVTKIGLSGICVGQETGYREGDISADIRRNGLVLENNVIRNNAIHAYGEIQKTYTSGVRLDGVGNRVCHNEIYDAPHMAIHYFGNEHLIEYNYIHDVVLYSSDAGAIYAGRNLSFYGNVIRYNAIADIGSGAFTPNGIYFDDCLAGQVAYGNIMINIPASGFLIGGGRDHKVYNNVIINARYPVSYDARAYDGLNRIKKGWYAANVETADSRQWVLMRDAQALYAAWLRDEQSVRIMQNSAADYSGIARMVGFDQKKKPDSAAVPNGAVYDNLLIADSGKIGDVAAIVKKHGSVRDNAIYRLSSVRDSFVDFAAGNYRIKHDSEIAEDTDIFRVIPFDRIGRVND